MEELSNENKIGSYLHCGKCLEEWKNTEEIRTKVSPKDYARIQVGWTEKGLQVWCNRHDCNMINIDFQGQKHPANVTAKREKSKGYKKAKKGIKKLKKVKLK